MTEPGNIIKQAGAELCQAQFNIKFLRILSHEQLLEYCLLRRKVKNIRAITILKGTIFALLMYSQQG